MTFTGEYGQEVELIIFDIEVEIYIGGYFLTSIATEDISKEATTELKGELR